MWVWRFTANPLTLQQELQSVCACAIGESQRTGNTGNGEPKKYHGCFLRKVATEKLQLKMRVRGPVGEQHRRAYLWRAPIPWPCTGRVHSSTPASLLCHGFSRRSARWLV